MFGVRIRRTKHKPVGCLSSIVLYVRLSVLDDPIEHIKRPIAAWSKGVAKAMSYKYIYYFELLHIYLFSFPLLFLSSLHYD